MDGLEEVIELHAVYGFKRPIVIDLETVDSEWLEGHCDVVGLARSRAQIPPGLWLARGCVAEVTETRLFGRRDERAVRTISGPIVVRFARAEGPDRSTRWEWANTGNGSDEPWQSPGREQRIGSPRRTRESRPICNALTCAGVPRFRVPGASSLLGDERDESASRLTDVREPRSLASERLRA